MNIISRIPHEIKTKLHAVLTYRSNNCSVAFICRKYHCSKASLMRWNNKYDGTIDSLANKSHRPLSKHPNSHTNMELNNIKKIIRRNPHIGLNEIYTKLVENYNYKRHYTSLYRILRSIGFYKDFVKPIKRYSPKPYHTPACLGEKWQMDVKYIPNDCNANLSDDFKYFQYTVIDEASRKRFIYPYKEQSSYSTCDFIMKAIKFFGNKPRCIQTDNGFEFTYFKDTKRIHPVDILLNSLGIEHKTIKPRTPRHNGKVERSHRNDSERFYRFLKFYSYEDLIYQMSKYLYRSNRILSSALGWKSPIQKEIELINQGLINYII